MNCREAKVAIALHLGNDDADPADWEEARRHASGCMECRGHYKRVKKSMALLEQADVEKTYDDHQSLWPAVEAQLTRRPGQKRERTPRSWTPFISFTVACLLFLAVWINPPRTPNHSSHPGAHSQRGIGGGPFAGNIVPPRQQTQQDDHKKDDKTRETL